MGRNCRGLRRRASCKVRWNNINSALHFEIGVLKARGIASDQFPLFTSVHQCCYEGLPVSDFLKGLENHPAHASSK